MKYYAVADVHGYFDALKTTLEANGFFTDTDSHKLIVCGDLFDRGKQAVNLQSFILNLLEQNEVILIKGNHEDLALDLLNGWPKRSYFQYHHHTNGTIDTVLQLTESTMHDLLNTPEDVGEKFLQSPFIQRIIPAMCDYYETSHYIFVHGWIPCENQLYRRDWRFADENMWNKARWLNGMEAAYAGVIEPNKTIVCGHWHCSFGHSRYEGKGGEFDNNLDFTPYYNTGIIALDACTPVSGKINCIVIED